MLNPEQPATVGQVREAFDAIFTRFLNLSQALAEKERGPEGVAAAVEKARAEGILESFGDFPHPYDALMRWYDKTS